MYKAILVSNQRLDYVKKDGSAVHANILDFVAAPQSDFEGNNRDGFVIHNVYHSDDDQRVDTALIKDLAAGSLCEIDTMLDRWNNDKLLGLRELDVVDLSILFKGGD